MDIRKYFTVSENTDKNINVKTNINDNNNFSSLKKYFTFDKNINQNIISEEPKIEIKQNINIPVSTESQVPVKLNKPKEKIDNSIHYVFTDGSTFNNNLHESKRYGGVGVYFENNEIEDISYSLKNCKISNNVAELTAIKMAIDTIIKYKKFNLRHTIFIYSDSKYSIDCFTKYCKTWEKNNWKKYNKGKGNSEIKNLDLIQDIWKYFKLYTIKFKHVNSHQTKPKDELSDDYRIWYGNDMADKLAVEASKKSKILINNFN
jgi:ribonuclease HI